MGIDSRIRNIIGKGARIALVFLLAFWGSFQAEIAVAYGSQPAPDYAGDISTYTPDAFHSLTVLVPNIEQDEAIEGDEFLASGVPDDEAAMKMIAEPGGTLQLGAMLEWADPDGGADPVSADAQGLVFWGVDDDSMAAGVASIDDKGLLTLGDGAAAGGTVTVTCALKDAPAGDEGAADDEISAGDGAQAGSDDVEPGVVKVTINLVEKPASDEPEDPTPDVIPPYVVSLLIVNSDENYYESKSVSATVAEGETYTLELGALVGVVDESASLSEQVHCTPESGLADATAGLLAEPLDELVWSVSGGVEGGASIDRGVLTVTDPSDEPYYITCSTLQGMNGGEVWDELSVTVSAEQAPEDNPPAAAADQGANNPKDELKVDIVNSTGGPVGETITLTLEDIEALDAQSGLYTVRGDNGDGNGDAFHTISGHGPALSTVLDRALGSVDADVALTTADIATVEFSGGSFSTGAWGYTDFVNRDRYYFPNIYSGGEGDAPYAGAVPVTPMIATTSYVNPYGVAGEPTEALVDNTRFRLLMGASKPSAASDEGAADAGGETPAGEENPAVPGDENPTDNPADETGESDDAPVVPNVGDDTKPFETVSLDHITIKLREGAGDSTGGDDSGAETDDTLRAMVTGQFAKKGQQATLSLNVGGTGDASFTIVWKESRDGGKTWEDYTEANFGEQTIHVLTDDEHVGRQYRADVHIMFTDGTDTDIESNAIELKEDDGSLSVGLGYEAVYNGDTAVFSATVNGADQGSVEYIWEESSDGGLTWQTVSGASGPTYATITDEVHLGNWYRVRVKDKDGNEATSNIQQMMALVDYSPVDEEGNFVDDENYDPTLDDLGYDYDDYYDYEDYPYNAPTVTEVESIEQVEQTEDYSDEMDPNALFDGEPVEDEDLVQDEPLSDDSLKLLVDPKVTQAIQEQEQKKLDSTPGAKWSQLTKIDAPTVKEILADNPFVPLSVPFCVGACAAGVVEKTVEYRNQKRKPADKD